MDHEQILNKAESEARKKYPHVIEESDLNQRLAWIKREAYTEGFIDRAKMEESEMSEFGNWIIKKMRESEQYNTILHFNTPVENYELFKQSKTISKMNTKSMEKYHEEERELLKSSIDWKHLREEFFSEHTEKDTGGFIHITTAPHDLFMWFRNKIEK
jgi:hypothetical protein